MSDNKIESKDLCPCGSGKPYSECCAPVIAGRNAPRTAEELMRARYSAYVKHEIDFIINTCERSEDVAEIDRKATEDWSLSSTWHGLRIIRCEKGGENDSEGVVEFEADYTSRGGMRDIHHEIGTFKKTDGKWLYVSGNVRPTTVVRDGRKIGRNEPCPCGSGKKYKNCCGRNI